jgi:hypothetical protein
LTKLPIDEYEYLWQFDEMTKYEMVNGYNGNLTTWQSDNMAK